MLQTFLTFMESYWYYFLIPFLVSPVLSLFYIKYLIRIPGTYLKWMIFNPISLFVNLLTYVLAPLLATISVIFKLKNLPFPLNAFQTYDDDLDGGQHQLGWPKDVSFMKLIFQRTHWFWRNPATTIMYWFASFDGSEGYEEIFRKTYGVWDGPGNNLEFVIVKNPKGKKAFALRSQWYYTNNKFLRVYFGWTVGFRTKYWFYKNSVNPFRSKPI